MMIQFLILKVKKVSFEKKYWGFVVTIYFETSRLLLRSWVPEDVEPMAKISASTRVMQFFPNLSTLDETKALIAHIENHFKRYGFGLFAVERKDTCEFIGFVGLNEVGFDIPTLQDEQKPIIEIGWRLSDKHWGFGFAPEAGRMVLKGAFEKFGLEKVVSFTAELNTKSIRVMEKIGLKHLHKYDFAHPNLSNESDLKPHVLYQLSHQQYLNQLKS